MALISANHRTYLFHLRVYPIDGIQPLPRHWLFIVERKWTIRGILRILMMRNDQQRKPIHKDMSTTHADTPISPDVLCMTENHALLIQQPIDAKFDTGLDDPPERSVVVVRNVRDQERVVRPAAVEGGHVG